jgi:hypothetical protein
LQVVPLVNLRRRRPLVMAAGLLGLLAVGWGAWRAVALPMAEAAIERATGHRASVGGLRPGLRTLEARDVVLFGAGPFASAPLARVARLSVALGGPGRGAFSPRAVLAEGVMVTYLRAGAVDNVRGPVTDSPTPAVAAAGARRRDHVALSLRRGRLEAFVRLPGGETVSLRSEELMADRSPAGDVSARLGRLVVDVAGALSVTAPRVELEAAAGVRRLSAQPVRVSVPAGGVLLDGLEATGEMTDARARFALVAPDRARGAGPPAFEASADIAGGGVRAQLQTRGLSLVALRPLARRFGVHLDGARLDARAQLDAEAGAAGQLSFDVGLAGLEVSHQRLDREPWRGLDLAARGHGSVSLAARRLVLERAQVTGLGLALEVRGALDLAPALRGQWHLETPKHAPLVCAALLPAQAAPVREVLAGMDLEGRLGLGMSLLFDAEAWEDLALELALEPRCRVRREPARLQELLPALRGGGRRHPPGGAPPDPAQPARLAQPAPPAQPAQLPIDRGHRDYVPLGAMPAWLPAAFLTAEDGRFFAHPGFDLEMIRRALAHDLEVADFARGASTITQQLAKNLFLGPERTLARKLEELVLAWRLHELLPKRRILELYLNVIELGPGIRGVKRAAEVYFGKPVAALTPLEAAHLAALTPNPLGYARRFREGRVDEGWLLKLYDLLGMMKRSGRLSAAELAAARNARLSLNRI